MFSLKTFVQISNQFDNYKTVVMSTMTNLIYIGLKLKVCRETKEFVTKHGIYVIFLYSNHAFKHVILYA